MNLSFNPPDTGSLRLTKALMIYERGDEYVVRTHDIIPGDRGPELGVGSFVTHDFINAIFASLKSTRLQIIPERVVAYTDETMIWTEPAMKRRLHFAHTGDKAVLARSGKYVPVPPLLFMADTSATFGGRLHVFALREDVRPTERTALYHAPFWNIYETGSVCIGSTPLPTITDIHQTKEWSNAFFESAFTHASSPGRWDARMTYAELLIASEKKGTFDPAWLVDSKHTLQSAIRGA